MKAYRPLSGSSYVKFLVELKSLKEWLINIKNNDQKCFLWCHVRHINPVKIHPETITGKDEELVSDLSYDGVRFPVRNKYFSKIETKTIFVLICIVMKTSCLFKCTFHVKNLTTLSICCWWLMKTCQITCTAQISTDSCFTKHIIKTKNTFSRFICSILVVKMYWQIINKFL